MNKKSKHKFHKISFWEVIFQKHNSIETTANYNKNCHGNAAGVTSAHWFCISVCHMVRKAAGVNIRTAIPSTPGQFTVTSSALAARAHQQNIYGEREAACRAAFGAKHSAKPRWQSQLRSREALQEESDTAPVQRKATVKRLYLPSPPLSSKNQLTGSLSRSPDPRAPPPGPHPPALPTSPCSCLVNISLLVCLSVCAHSSRLSPAPAKPHTVFPTVQPAAIVNHSLF